MAIVWEVEIEVALAAVVDRFAAVISLFRCGQIGVGHLVGFKWRGEPQHDVGHRLMPFIQKEEGSGAVERRDPRHELGVQGRERLGTGAIKCLPEAGEDLILPQVRGTDVDEADRIHRHQREVGLDFRLRGGRCGRLGAGPEQHNGECGHDRRRAARVAYRIENPSFWMAIRD